MMPVAYMIDITKDLYKSLDVLTKKNHTKFKVIPVVFLSILFPIQTFVCMFSIFFIFCQLWVEIDFLYYKKSLTVQPLFIQYIM